MGFEPLEAPTTDEAADQFHSRMETAVEEAKAAIAKAQDEYALYYNRRRTPAPVFKKGDRVFLDSSDISTDRPLLWPLRGQREGRACFISLKAA